MITHHPLLRTFVAPDLQPCCDLSRRGLLGAVGAAALLAACGTGDGAGGGSTPRTRRFEHAAGVTEVPVSPRRIVSLHSTALTWQLANLGVDSVGTAAAPQDDPTTYPRLVDPAIADRLAKAGIESVDGADGPDLERIAALRPDLIVGGGWQADLYERLSGIAPTVLIDSAAAGDRAFGVEVQLAELVGRQDELDRQLDAYEARIAEVRSRWADQWQDLTWAVVDEIDEEPAVAVVALDGTNPAYRVPTDLGAAVTPAVLELAPSEDESFFELSAELIPDLAADVVFVSPPCTLLEKDPTTPISDGTLRLPRDIPAGTSDQVLTVGLNWTNAGVASYDVILDDLERFIEERREFFATTA